MYRLTNAKTPLLDQETVAVVTGGLSGLGLELVKALVFQYKVRKVFLIDNQTPQFDFGPSVDYVKCDLASEADVRRAFQYIAGLDTRVLLIINNAGVRRAGALVNVTDEDVKIAFAVNTLGPIFLLRRLLSQHLLHYKNEHLSIVTVSSALASFGPRNLLLYLASKAAMYQAHECLVEELRDHPEIRMLLVVPGQLTTAMFRDVKPSRLFLAPLVNHTALAAKLLTRVSAGEVGTMCEPLYANFLHVMKVMPMVLQRLARQFTQMDEKVGAERESRST